MCNGMQLTNCFGVSKKLQAYHFHYDGNGNVTEITDISGNNAASYRYDAFGNTLNATGSYAALNRYRFSTKPLDNEVTNAPLYYYGYRYYDPLTGRWPSIDPIEEEGGVNLYGFVENNGLSYYDLFGACIGSIEIVFTSSSTDELKDTPQDSGMAVKSGRRYYGTMDIYDDKGNIMAAFNVASGGNIDVKNKNIPHNQDYDTTVPSESYHVEDKILDDHIGFKVNGTVGRSAIEIHRQGLTTGCITTAEIDRLIKIMDENHKSDCCKHDIPTEIEYDTYPAPKGNNGNGRGDPGHKIKFPKKRVYRAYPVVETPSPHDFWHKFF